MRRVEKTDFFKETDCKIIPQLLNYNNNMPGREYFFRRIKKILNTATGVTQNG